MISVFDVASANLLVFDPLPAGARGCVSMMRSCGIGEEDDNERKWDALRTKKLASCQIGISSSHHDHYAQDESYWVWLQVSGVSHRPAICNQSVRCCQCDNRDQLRCMTAEKAQLLDMNRLKFKRKDVCWCLSQIIPGILHETNAKNYVMLQV
jgi:hypothetical protein